MKEIVEVKDKKRNYNLELLRILSMLMIITLHYCTFGYKITAFNSFGYKTPILWLIYAFCFVAVNLYVLISGYFMINSNFKWKKLIKLWIEVLFYSLGIGIVFYLFDVGDFSNIKTVLKFIFPVLSKMWWYVTVYFCLYVLSPYLNKLLKSLEKKEYQQLLIILSVIFLLLNNFIPGINLIDATKGYGIIWFIYLYMVAAYIRLYDFPKIKPIYYLIGYCIASFITFGSRFFILKYLNNDPMWMGNEKIMYAYNSLSVFVASLCLFMYFKEIKIKPIFEKLVVKISGATFGVYLIHEHFLVRNVLYSSVLKVREFSQNDYKGLIMIGSILAVFFICVIVDLIRQKIFHYIEK